MTYTIVFSCRDGGNGSITESESGPAIARAKQARTETRLDDKSHYLEISVFRMMSERIYHWEALDPHPKPEVEQFAPIVGVFSDYPSAERRAVYRSTYRKVGQEIFKHDDLYYVVERPQGHLVAGVSCNEASP